MNKTDGHIQLYNNLTERNKTEQAKEEKRRWAAKTKKENPDFFKDRTAQLNSPDAMKKKKKKFAKRKDNPEYLRKQSIAQRKRFGVYVEDDNNDQTRT